MNEQDLKPTIDLLDFNGLGLILPFSSGVVYTNQVGGLGCLHPEIEGVFVPLSIGHKKAVSALETHLNGDWNHIEEEDAKIVDKILRVDGFGYMKVDRSNLEQSFEAWIYVEIEELTEPVPIINGFGKTKGILTWANSD